MGRNDIRRALTILMFEMLVCSVIAKFPGNHTADDKSLAPSQPEEPEPEEKYDEDDYSQLQACIGNCKNDYIREPEKLLNCIEVCYKSIYD
ncbi:hypothetical protein AAHE18_03G179000 [Arachis hypogaea]|nr:uncharacterized protein DS421_3g82570 [Arachis hypogaea]